MIVRAIGLGFFLWLAAALVLRFYGQHMLTPEEGPRLILFLVTPFVAGLAATVFLRLLKEAHGDEAEAAVGLALPGMLLTAFVTHEFASVFPNIDPTLDGVFAAIMMLAFSTILFVGLSLTKLAAQDERI